MVSAMLLEDLRENVETQALVLRWLAYLLQQVDHKNLETLLKYYQDIRWISEDVRKKLLFMAKGIKSSGIKNEWMVPHRVHLTSLLFIEKLRGESPGKDLAGLNAYIKGFIETPEEFLSV